MFLLFMQDHGGSEPSALCFPKRQRNEEQRKSDFFPFVSDLLPRLDNAPLLTGGIVGGPLQNQGGVSENAEGGS